MELSLLHYFFHIQSLLSVPFYDIISANNVETEHENEVEFDEAQNIVHNPDTGNNGEETRNVKELNILRSGQSFEVDQGQDSSHSNGREISDSKFNDGEGEFNCTLLSTL